MARIVLVHHHFHAITTTFRVVFSHFSCHRFLNQSPCQHYVWSFFCQYIPKVLIYKATTLCHFLCHFSCHLVLCNIQKIWLNFILKFRQYWELLRNSLWSVVTNGHRLFFSLSTYLRFVHVRGSICLRTSVHLLIFFSIYYIVYIILVLCIYFIIS